MSETQERGLWYFIIFFVTSFLVASVSLIALVNRSQDDWIRTASILGLAIGFLFGYHSASQVILRAAEKLRQNYYVSNR